ncbi:MAG: hypothetical protein MZV65_43095 [Chromatiales bacterium]|nr:hypothetical protein [Chromatiales bacterium]
MLVLPRRLAGIVQVSPSISSQRIPTTSPGRWPVIRISLRAEARSGGESRSPRRQARRRGFPHHPGRGHA